MDESLTGIMTIIGPLILLVLLAWLVMRSRRGPNQTPTPPGHGAGPET